MDCPGKNLDEQQLQQRAVDLKVKENELNVRESDLNSRETQARFGLDLTINTQEFLRRAIEIGTNALQKIDAMSSEVANDDLPIHLEELIDTAAVKLKEELDKLGK
jgi:hypothetical protein